MSYYNRINIEITADKEYAGVYETLKELCTNNEDIEIPLTGIREFEEQVIFSGSTIDNGGDDEVYNLFERLSDKYPNFFFIAYIYSMEVPEDISRVMATGGEVDIQYARITFPEFRDEFYETAEKYGIDERTTDYER